MHRWLAENVPPERIRVRVDNLTVVREYIRQGLGVGHELCLTGDADPRVRRIGGTLRTGLSLWILTHPDLRSTARMRAFTTHLADCLLESRDRLEGTSGSDALGASGP
jgi:DNA-binding transcriptional LysR family regulator